MSKDKALEHLALIAPGSQLDSQARDRRAQMAQVEATLFVGEQLERIADMVEHGFVAGEGNVPGVTIIEPLS